MTAIIVCPLIDVERQIAENRPSHLVSLLGPDRPHRTYDGIAAANHLRLTFHDVAAPAPGLTAPGMDDARAIIAFLKAWDRQSPVLIHCWAGISRSTAAAYTALCMARPRADELDLAQELRKASPTATPNPLLVSYADTLLERSGQMTRAVDRIGRGENAFLGAPFQLPL